MITFEWWSQAWGIVLVCTVRYSEDTLAALEARPETRNIRVHPVDTAWRAVR